MGYLSPIKIANTVALYRYYSPGATDHFYTTNANEIGSYGNPGLNVRHGYKYEGIQGYIANKKLANTQALYRYWKGGRYADHFYTTNANEIGSYGNPGRNVKHGYKYEGIAGYVFTTPRSTSYNAMMGNNENDMDNIINNNNNKPSNNGIYFNGVNVTNLIVFIIGIMFAIFVLMFAVCRLSNAGLCKSQKHNYSKIFMESDTTDVTTDTATDIN